MKVSVCVPHRATDLHRVANNFCSRRQWHALGWPVYEGDSNGVFSRSEAINRAAAEADGDVLMIADTDIVLANPRQATEAAELALQENAYVVAFSNLVVLDQTGTNTLRQGRKPAAKNHLYSVGLIWGGCFAVSRTLFDLVGGFDERFVGYGAEDVGFLVSASTLGVKHRVEGDAYHLTHSDPDKSMLPTNSLLGERYRAADGDKEAILSLIAERS